MSSKPVPRTGSGEHRCHALTRSSSNETAVPALPGLARQPDQPSAAALYCRALLDHDPAALFAAAERYDDASRPLQRAKALEAAAGYFADADDRGQAQAACTGAVEVYISLGAAADIARVQTMFRARVDRRGPHAEHRRATRG